ncbi:demethylmenaquinone methyltransferase [Schaalia sp. 19OD2882]|uniref:demethylmenaquinone methyltransferase n=1 Tax=Schaalia sp. 19OD2882 TaxID=2794089 RepID=UPI001C1EF65A|nr:demethylmenaquinone methyltransferase [Schaalia sp. 19OD2882]QWW19874.1 demethylmenaquinone methyltransferase [Schaalia sp. 19OD2882]
MTSLPDGGAPTAVRRAELDKVPSQIASMFDHVATRYDLMNTLLTGGMDHVWLAALRNAVALRAGQRLLDVAAGTGASSAAMAATGARVVACDLSEGMVEVGRFRHPELQFVVGDAMDLPFADSSFDAVTISYGLRNIPDPVRALREMLRVVRPGGRLVVSEFSTPTNRTFRRLYEWHLGHVMPAMARIASSDDVAYDYLAESILDWPDQVGVARMLLEAGWDRVAYRNLTGGIVALHRGFRPLG